MNEAKARRKVATHSKALSFSGELVASPTGGCRLVALDNAEAPARLRLVFAPAPKDQPGGRADSTGQQEADP